MENLQDFMLLFSMQANQQAPTTEELTAMHQAWGKFIGGIAAQAKLVSASRLGFDGNLIDGSLTVTKGIHVSNHATLTGNMVVKAASLHEATEIAKACPVLAMGGSVEVRNIIPM